MAHYPKKTIFSPSSGLESPRPEQRSIFTQSPSLPRPQTTYISQMPSSPLPEGVPRLSSNPSVLSNGFRIVSMNLDTMTETMKNRNRSPLFRMDHLEKKNALLEEEIRKLMEINTFFGGDSEKIKDLERKINIKQEENGNLFKEIQLKKMEISNMEKLLKAHQEEHNLMINTQNKECQEFKEKYLKLQSNFVQEIEQKNVVEKKHEEIINSLKQKHEDLREEYTRLLSKFKEITNKYEEQVHKNQEIEQYYAKTMLEYKAEITSIRSQYDAKIQTLSISKDKFTEFVNVTRSEADHLRKQIKDKNEEIEKLNQLFSKINMNNENNNNNNSNNNSEFPSKKYNIDDFGEKIANLLQENDKINEKCTFHEIEASQWKEKYLSLRNKIQLLNNTNTNNSISQAYLQSEPDYLDEEDNNAILKEKNLNFQNNVMVKTGNIDHKSNFSINSSVNNENKRPSYNKANNSTITKRKMNNENNCPQVKVSRNSSSSGNLRSNKIEGRNFSYSIRKNY